MTTEYDSSSTSDDGLDKRPRKRVRTSPAPSPTVRRLLLEELDLEIALQERLASAVESRISWALLLQQHALDDGHDSTPLYAQGLQESAISAMEAIEEPCNIIYTPQLRSQRPPQMPPALPTSNKAIVSVPAGSAQAASLYSTRTRGLSRVARPPPRRLLFLRNHATSPPQIVKLSCPDCAKADFSSLQGLLNHCRLRHQREFGSHDECVQHCAVLVEGEEQQVWVVENGTEVGGISLPGLRRLFELAVGGGQGLGVFLPPLQSTRKEIEELPPGRSPIEASAPPVLEPDSVTSRTLGLHADSPALAPYLGREPKRRCIRTIHEEGEANVLDRDDAATGLVWRMHYTHRSQAKASLDEVVEPLPVPAPVEHVLPDVKLEDTNFASSETPTISVRPAPGSRFHVRARVSVQDFSLRITHGGRRHDQANSKHTHHWRIVVSSPSYSLPLSTYLRRLTVTCLTEPPTSTLQESVTIFKSPFVITSTTDRPFLARLRFEWTGSDGINPATTLEHWVELDESHASNPVLGEEQFFDVELDRNTEFMPLSEEPIPTWNDVAKDAEPGTTADISSQQDLEKKVEPVYVEQLKSLSSQFPLTLKEGRGRPLAHVPYTLVSSPAQFRSLVYGRQKAIQWARARALRAAYEEQYVASLSDDATSDIVLTTGDVFHWLEDQYSIAAKPRPTIAEATTSSDAQEKQLHSNKDEDSAELYCRFCGLHYYLHPSAVAETQLFADSKLDRLKMAAPVAVIPNSSPANPVCQKFNPSCSMDLPVLGVNGLPVLTSTWPLSRPPVSQDDVRRTTTLSARALAATAEPDFIALITSTTACPTTASLLSRRRIDVEEDIAPAALLALAAKLLVKRLIGSGSEAYHRDEDELQGLGRTRLPKDGQVRRLLTPMHVLRGLLYDAPRVREAGALLLLLAPLGMSLPALPVDAEVYSG